MPILDIPKMSTIAKNFMYSQASTSKLMSRLDIKQEELRRDNNYRLSLYESYKDDIISREDFINFRVNYDT